MNRDVPVKALRAGFLAVALLATPALAVEPAHWQAGPVAITPTLDSKVGYVDNLFRSDRDQKDTWSMITTPQIQAWMQNGMNSYSLTYKLVDYRYFDSSNDDFTDQQLNLDIHHEFNVRNSLNVKGEFYDGHEQRGVGLSEGIGGFIDEPVELERTRFGGDYTYGSNSAKGRLVLGADTRSLQYQNFRESTQYRDRDQDTLSGAFYWQVAPRTDLIGEVRYIDNQYDLDNLNDPSGTLDSEEMNYLVGVSWDATAKASGHILVGVADRKYDSAARSNTNNHIWEVDLTWALRSYSKLNLMTRRLNRETNGLGDAIDSQEYKVTWDHQWNSRSSTKLALAAVNDEYTGSLREDDLITLDAKYNYAFRRWVDFGAGYRYEKRDSTLGSLDFNLNIYYIEGKISL